MSAGKTACENGHPLGARSLRATVPCGGCNEMTSPVYDCDHRCYGRCAEGWGKNVRNPVSKAMALPGGQ